MRSHRHRLAAAVTAATIFASGHAAATTAQAATLTELSPTLKVGDLVFVRIQGKLFTQVAADTNSWTNHVGVVLEASDTDPVIAESAVPWSRTTRLSKFVQRSEGGRVAIVRLASSLDAAQEASLATAVARRHGVLYDTGFNLHSKRQFCSRFVREVLLVATGVEVGQVETLQALLSRRPQANMTFWKLWYFGRIPWQRETVTPASMLESPVVHSVFDGVAMKPPLRSQPV